MTTASDRADAKAEAAAEDRADVKAAVKAKADSDAAKAASAKPAAQAKMSLADLAEWIRHITKLGGGLDGTQVQQVLGVLDSYGGEPTKREQTYVQTPVPAGPPPAPPLPGPGK